eukprot:m.12956 g.12956  ORF g.12956 m.12956 type:complete len:59 (-) comp4605_c0_seq1:3-179(-)
MEIESLGLGVIFDEVRKFLAGACICDAGTNTVPMATPSLQKHMAEPNAAILYEYTTVS